MHQPVKYLTPISAILLLAACSGEPEWKEVYEQCKESVKAQSESIKSSVEGDEQTRAMAESMGNMAISMAMTACEMIRTNCEQDEESPTCRAYVDQGKQQ